LNSTIEKYDFHKTKYGEELLIDLIRLESLEKYIVENCPHSLSYFDITLITGGHGNFSIDQYKYPIHSKIVLFSSPGQVRHWDIKQLPTGYVLIFEEEFLSSFLNDSQFINGLKYFNTYLSPPKLNLSATDNRYLIKLMQDTEQEISAFSNTDKHILKALLFQILVWLNRRFSDEHPSSGKNNYNRHIQGFINLVNKEFSNQHSVLYYANALNITAGHLNYLCNSHLGIGAKKYIQNKIILEAKRLLLYSDLPISEIAYRLDFEDPSYFIRKFKQLTNITPLSFRKNQNP
jgi:AraC-like DNA-binding protein